MYSERTASSIIATLFAESEAGRGTPQALSAVGLPESQDHCKETCLSG